jgi:hypothetical protein
MTIHLAVKTIHPLFSLEFGVESLEFEGLSHRGSRYFVSFPQQVLMMNDHPQRTDCKSTAIFNTPQEVRKNIAVFTKFISLQSDT